MKKLINAALVTASLTMTGCASIISGSTQTLVFKSVPEESNITITNKSGEKIHTGITPATVTLKRGNGYFKPASYTVQFKKDGYQTKSIEVRANVNGWYFANILFGGLIGMLIIDPATGAMYTLNPNDINAVLESNETVQSNDEHSLTVMLVKDVPIECMKKAKYIATI